MLGENESDEEQDAGDVRRMKKLINPRMPTKDEVEAHEMTHLPFRNWCRHCVKGRGVETGHRKVAREEGGLPEVHVDFAFPTSVVGTDGLIVVVAKERNSRMLLSEVIPRKGTVGKFAATRVVAFIRELGYGSAPIIMKSDQEPAILALVNDIAKYRAPAQTVLEQSPVGSSGSNGIVERGVQSFEMMMRVMKDALEHKWNVKIPDDHPVLTWMVGYSSFLLNRFEVGSDGKTSYERLKGKRAKTNGLEFCEGLLFKMKAKREGIGKLASVWEDGVYLGIRAVSGEVIVGTSEGVWRTRTIRRKPMETRWDPDNSLKVGGVPWKTSADDEGDGMVPKGVIKLEAKQMEKDGEDKVRATPVVPRAFAIRQADLVKHGFTEDCAGCKAMIRGMNHQKHSEACRERMTKLMKEEEKVKEAPKRASEFVEEVAEGVRENKRVRVAWADVEDDPVEEEEPVVELDRGAKRGRREDPGDDVAYDDEGTRLNIIEFEEKIIMVVNVEDEEEELIEEAIDDVNGENLDPEAVAASRAEEVEFMQTRGIWEVVDVDLCWQKLGKGPTTVKWVDTRKRSRLVGRDFKPKGEQERADIFASMPPWEAKKLLFSMAASQEGLERKKKLLFVDATKAHVNGVCDVDAFIELPPEAHEDGKCAKLKHWLYGMRPAARAWEDLYALKLVGVGFKQGSSAPTVFSNKEKEIDGVVHGDDFTFLGYEEDLLELAEQMASWFEVKVRGIVGPEAKDMNSIIILNRTLEWFSWGIRITADPKHAEKIIAHFGLDSESKSVVSPGTKIEVDEDVAEDDDEEVDPKLEGPEVTVFRGLAATMNYMSSDRYDTQFAGKELCREMSKPTSLSMVRAKRAARYLVGVPVVHIEYRNQKPPKRLSIYADSDWAGCRKTRKSTSGGVACHGMHCIRTWSSTQATIATSSGEAEFYALIESASRGLGLQTLAKDLGQNLGVDLYSDASAGRSMAFRKGLGKVRHMDTKFLWIQDLVKTGRLKVLKVKGVKNPADVGTKHLAISEMEEKLASIGMKVVKNEKR